MRSGVWNSINYNSPLPPVVKTVHGFPLDIAIGEGLLLFSCTKRYTASHWISPRGGGDRDSAL